MTDETANAVQTIEEAWADTARCFLWHEQGVPATRREQDAARALALASAKAMLPPRSHPGPKTGIEKRYLAVKAQIESLGR